MIRRVVEWAVLQAPAGERHLIGVDVSNIPRDVIISAPLTAFAPEDRLVTDAEGVDYELTDVGNVSVPARRAWREWCRERSDLSFVEVTEEYEAAINFAAQVAQAFYEPPDKVAIEARKREELRSRRELVAEGRLVRSEVLSSHLGGSQNLLRALSRGKVFWLDVDGVRYFPSFFLDHELDLAKFEELARVLRKAPGWAMYAFLVSPIAALDGATPIEALKLGKLREVKEAATGFIQP